MHQISWSITAREGFRATKSKRKYEIMGSASLFTEILLPTPDFVFVLSHFLSVSRQSYISYLFFLFKYILFIFGSNIVTHMEGGYAMWKKTWTDYVLILRLFAFLVNFISMYRLWLHGLYELYGPRCPLSPRRPLNLITHSLLNFIYISCENNQS